MASPVKPYRPAAWLTKKALAAVFDVNQSYLDREIRQFIRPEHVRRARGRLLFYGRGVIEAWANARAKPQGKAAREQRDEVELEAWRLRAALA